MSKELIHTFKSNIKKQYETATQKLNDSRIVFNVKSINLENEYNNVIKLMDKEFLDFKQCNSHYSILSSTAMKEYKLNSELQTISDNFLRQISILTNPKYILGLEEELIANEQQQKLIELEQKQLEKLRNGILFISTKEIADKVINTNRWF